MEREFSKQEILGLYLNVIYFGQRAYGVAAAAEAFFGKSLPRSHRLRSGDARGRAAGAVEVQPDHQSRVRARPGAATCWVACTSSVSSTTRRTTTRERRPSSLARMPRCPRWKRRTWRRWRVSICAPASVRPRKRRDTGCTRRSTAACRRRRIARCASASIEYDRRHGWRGPIGHADVAGRTKEEQFEELLEEYTSVGFLVARRRRVRDGEDGARVRALARFRADRVGRPVLGAQGRTAPGAEDRGGDHGAGRRRLRRDGRQGHRAARRSCPRRRARWSR